MLGNPVLLEGNLAKLAEKLTFFPRSAGNDNGY